MIGLALLLASSASAQDTGAAEEGLHAFSADALRPIAWSEQLLYVSPARADAEGVWRADLAWTHDPLVLGYSDGSERALLGDVVTLNAAAGFRLGPARVEASAPFVLYAGSDVREPNGPLLGDPEVGVTVEALERGGLALAPLARLRLPSGADAWQLGHPGVAWELGGAADLRIGAWTLAGNAGLRGLPETELFTFSVNDQLWYRLGAATASGDLGFGLELAGHAPVRDRASGASSPLELSGGLSWRGLRLGAGVGVTDGIGAPAWRITLGAAQRASREDT